MTLDSLNAFTVAVAPQSVLWKYTHEGKTCNINGKTENCNCLLSINWIVLRIKIRSVLDKYTASKFNHCEFNPQQGRLFFFILENKLRLFIF